MMKQEEGAKIALGLITRDLLDTQHVFRFLDNAASFGHTIERVIIAYSHDADPGVIQEIEARTALDVLCAHDAPSLEHKLIDLGLKPDEIEGLIGVPSWQACREVPYGTYRNIVLMQALLEGMDYLLFFDTDVEPRVLTGLENDIPAWQEVDFVGTHMASLTRDEVSATTSEYSGYYIIPPMAFQGFSDLLYGLGKGMALDYMDNCGEHQCLNLGSPAPRRLEPTFKPLGGNLGLSLTTFWRLAPFYSTTYRYQDLGVRGRGEDTLLGQALTDAEGVIMDIDLRVFHDTYVDFPQVPSIHRRPIRDRFYMACLGWIGRNPFLTWFLEQRGRLETSRKAEIQIQRLGLEVGGQAMAEYLGDERFAHLPEAFECSLNKLPASIERFTRLIQGWSALISTLGRGEPLYTGEDEIEDWLPLAS
jgi:hypothetical protein